jgi:hypothetical protein
MEWAKQQLQALDQLISWRQDWLLPQNAQVFDFRDDFSSDCT